MKIVEYKMAWAQHPTDLERRVNILLKDGYEVFGSPQCPSSGPFTQCMVKRELPTAEQEPGKRGRHPGRISAATERLIEDMQ